ncbi:MAG TPA: type II toxin-antitoxin system VapC family toxin [Terriglobales bacterium]
MTILDTNVISEIMASSPSEATVAWFARARAADELFTTTITVAEVLYGIELLPAGKRREKLNYEAEATFTQDFAGRILGFNEQAARRFAQVASSRRKAGRPIAEFDAQIAAIAYVHGAVLATRNTADFESCGIRLVNPWVD